LPLRLLGVPRSPALHRAAEVLEALGLAARRDARPRTLSGGDRGTDPLGLLEDGDDDRK